MTARVAARDRQADCDRHAAGNRRTARLAARDRRRGFTLIELMIVIVIIIILISILVPAVGSAIRNAREGQVSAELSQFNSAIADFKAQFGVEPPSYIDFQLYDASGALDPTTGTLKPATQAKLRRIWPNIDIAAFTGSLRSNAASQKLLDGHACLVFFLGGMTPAANEVPVGFSSNPRSPFVLGGKRIGPFFEFQLSRLFDADPATWNGYEGYKDPLPGQQLPYFYITSDRYAAQEALNNTITTAPGAAIRPVYRQSASSFFNPNGFQIISPGPDGVTVDKGQSPGGSYGAGGLFDPKKGTVTDNLATGHALKGQAKGDLDNITNFHGGRLVP